MISEHQTGSVNVGKVSTVVPGVVDRTVVAEVEKVGSQVGPGAAGLPAIPGIDERVHPLPGPGIIENGTVFEAGDDPDQSGVSKSVH